MFTQCFTRVFTSTCFLIFSTFWIFYGVSGNAKFKKCILWVNSSSGPEGNCWGCSPSLFLLLLHFLWPRPVTAEESSLPLQLSEEQSIPNAKSTGQLASLVTCCRGSSSSCWDCRGCVTMGLPVDLVGTGPVVTCTCPVSSLGFMNVGESSVWILLPSWLGWAIQITNIWSLLMYKNDCFVWSNLIFPT